MIWAEVLTNQERGFDSPDAADRFELRFAPVAGRAILWLALAAGPCVDPRSPRPS